MSEQTKAEIIDLVNNCKTKGINRNRVCTLLQIDDRRVRNWVSRPSLIDIKPGPQHAPHALLPEEREAIISIAKDELYVDDSHRILAAKCIDSGTIAVSASTVYNVMREEGLTTDRSGRSHRNGNSRKPERPELTGSKQRWCWDISYLRTLVPGIFLYLYVLLDEYSRKIVAFRISWSMTNEEGKELIQEGIDNEFLSQGEIAKLVLFNDRGTQMKAKPFKKFLEVLGISQKFARPRTPNDNPFIESLFSTVKGAIRYPSTFTDDIEAIAYFTSYFNFYNNVRLHGKIGYVTPAQRHCGQDKAILSLRRDRIANARKKRLQINRYTITNNITNDEIVENEKINSELLTECLL